MRSIVSRLVFDAEHHEQVIEAVRRATVSVWIATANLKDVHVPRSGSRRYMSMLAVLDEMAGRGVELRILHAGLPSRSFRDSFDGFPRLVEGGLELRQCPRVHLKTVIVDGRWLYAGSANWTGAGLGLKSPRRRNFEAGWVTADAAAIDQMQERFDRIWSGGHCGACGLRAECEAPLDLVAGPRPRAVVRLRRPGERPPRSAAPRRDRPALADRPRRG
jgi:phosphatidylserine/phosphatidylglycerophosphate/cardiolipin synthase-like enzyme